MRKLALSDEILLSVDKAALMSGVSEFIPHGLILISL